MSRWDIFQRVQGQILCPARIWPEGLAFPEVCHRLQGKVTSRSNALDARTTSSVVLLASTLNGIRVGSWGLVGMVWAEIVLGLVSVAIVAQAVLADDLTRGKNKFIYYWILLKVRYRQVWAMGFACSGIPTGRVQTFGSKFKTTQSVHRSGGTRSARGHWKYGMGVDLQIAENEKVQLKQHLSLYFPTSDHPM